MDDADQFIDRVPRLPPTPTIATELLGIFKQADPDIDRIAQLIQHDPALTAEVLKRCNSAYFGRERVVSDMFEAIIRVGFYEVYCVVLSMVGTRAMSLAQTGSPLDARALWHHSVKTAVAASALSGNAREDEAVAFTAGLLHDIGKLIFASASPEEYANVIRETGSFGPGLVAQEKAVFGLTHAAVGSRLLARWGFPINVVLAVMHHHGSPAAAASCEPLAATINLANGIAHMGADDGAASLTDTNSEAMRILDITPEGLPKVIARTEKGLERVQELLHMAV